MEQWRKSSRSADQSNCVEVRSDLSALRDSKNRGGPMLVVPTTGVAALITIVASRR